MKDKLIRMKICGMRDPDNIREVAALKPDYMGFIFYAKSPRFFANPVIADAHREIVKVGVFVNESEENIMFVTGRNSIRVVQLHGDESPAFCEKLRKLGLDVIKVFRVDRFFNFNQTIDFESVTNYFLFDTKGETHGGTGLRFDWNVLEKYNQRIPFFLSGGLNHENMMDMGHVMQMNLHAIDLNSGLEESPGRKDIKKVKQAFNNLYKINYHGIPGR
jgi:phosphoribosylanthranilate isomerase